MRTIILRNGTSYAPDSTEPEHFNATLGRLSQWALLSESYHFVEVSIHSTGDMAAAYWLNAEQAQARVAMRPPFYIFAKLATDGSYSFLS